MESKSEEKTGRTWADVFIAVPRYIIVLLLAAILAMIVRTEISEGITKYGFLGEWGRVPPGPATADDAIIGAAIRMNRQLECAKLTLDSIPAQIGDWKQYMELTAETSSNPSLRQSRTATWKAEVDDVVRQIKTTELFLSGERNSC